MKPENSRTKTVVVSGCGNIGSRLLQSLARVTDHSMEIVGVEPNGRAREIAVERFQAALLGRHTLRFAQPSVSGTDAFPKHYDLLVVSSDARNRMVALDAALDSGTPAAVVLEKILFTRSEDYSRAAARLAAIGAPCWVNTSRNLWPGYRELRDRLRAEGDPVFDYAVRGGDWNLGSNAIHFLSVVEYLANSPITTLEFAPLGSGVRCAKRPGYLEVMGCLSGKTARGDRVTLVSDPNAKTGVAVTLDYAGQSLSIAEAAGTICGAGDGQAERFTMLHASQLEAAFSSILAGGRCELPDLASSTRLHRTMFEALLPTLGLSVGDEIPLT